jgi:hypothetical protein
MINEKPVLKPEDGKPENPGPSPVMIILSQ